MTVGHARDSRAGSPSDQLAFAFVDDELDGLTWHDWFVTLPRTAGVDDGETVGEAPPVQAGDGLVVAVEEVEAS